MSICDDCVKKDICTEEDMGEEALTFCAYRYEEKQKKAEWIQERDAVGKPYYICSECQHSLHAPREEMYDRHFYCDVCGSEMIMIRDIPEPEDEDEDNTI